MASTKLPITPVGGNILVEPEAQEQTTPSGLVVAASAKGEKPQSGVVVALGKGKKDKDGKPIEWNVSVGQKVLFKKYSPDEFEHEGKKYLIMQEEDVLGVINA